MRGIFIASIAVLSAAGLLVALVLSGSANFAIQALGLPFNESGESGTTLFKVQNTGDGTAIEGETDSSSAQQAGVYGHTTDTAERPAGLVSGVWGDSARGFGVVGTSDNIAVFGLSESGTALDAFSVSGTALLLNTRSGDFIVANGLDDNNNVNRRFYVNNSGEVFADGPFNSGGADVADLFAVAEQVEEGDVLEIAPNGEVTRSRNPYSPAVIGVVSSNPSLVGNANAQTEPGNVLVPVALTGVVDVKVTAENGVIQPGDLLVASSVSGHAMRAGEHPPIGSVVGKALQSLDSESGIIRMLVMLR